MNNEKTLRKVMSAIAVLCAAVGCTASQFEKPDTTPQQMEKDKYECELAGRSANAGRSVQQDLYRRCMAQRGYALKT